MRLPINILLVATLLCAAVAGGLCAWVRLADAKDRERLAARSAFVTVDGARIRTVKAGPGAQGGPTVVIEAGLFDVVSDWVYIIPELAKSVRVFAYDRPGVGLSDPLGGAKDARSGASDLHRILAAAGVGPPYVLAGHSIGAAYVLAYATLYPGEVNGVALLDPMHADELEREPPENRASDLHDYAQIAKFARLAPFGVARLIRPFRGFGAGLPAEDMEEVETLNRSRRHLEGVASEVEALPVIKDQLRAMPPLGAVPLGILTATQPPGGMTAAYLEMHKELLKLSTRSFHRLSARGDHGAIIHDQTVSRDSIALIQEVLAAAAAAGYNPGIPP